MSRAKMVPIRNGTYEFEPLVQGIIHSLVELRHKDPLAFHDLVMKCRDNNYQLSKGTAFIAQNWAVLNINGGVIPNLRNVVTAAVEGDGMDMVITDPIQQTKSN